MSGFGTVPYLTHQFLLTFRRNPNERSFSVALRQFSQDLRVLPTTRRQLGLRILLCLGIEILFITADVS